MCGTLSATPGCRLFDMIVCGCDMPLDDPKGRVFLVDNDAKAQTFRTFESPGVCAFFVFCVEG